MSFTMQEYSKIVENVAGLELRLARRMPSYQVKLGYGFRVLCYDPYGRRFHATQHNHATGQSWGSSEHERWRSGAIVEMADTLDGLTYDRRRDAIQTAEQRAEDRVRSHQQMARVRAARGRRQRQQWEDTLAARKPGWVVREMEVRRALRQVDRLQHQRKILSGHFLPYYERAGFRQAVASGWVEDSGHETIVLAEETMPPGCSSASEVVWDRGRRGRSATFSSHTFWLHRRWKTRVADRGLALLDGMLTLDARRRDARGTGVSEAYEATWVRQGRGTALVQEHGVIVRLSPDSPWVHGDDLRSAAKTAKRRGNLDRRRARENDRNKAIEAANWDAVWPDQDLKHVQVCLQDSKSVGNCDTGTRAWIARWMPEYQDETCAPATEVLAAATRDNTGTRRSAVAAVHRAILRSRKGRAA